MRSLLLFCSLSAFVGCSSSDAASPDGDGGGTDAGGTDTGAAVDFGPPPTDAPAIGPCRIFPPDNPWNMPVDKAPLHKDSAAFIAAMAPTRGMHPDWGNWSKDHYGIPWQLGTGAAPVKINMTTTYGPRESDKRPCGDGSPFCYPIPLTVKIEGGPGASGGSDRHVLYLDTAGAPNDCTLYELYNTQNPTTDFRVASAAVFPLGTNALRPEGWTSADAAGLPILPGLVRLSELKSGAIKHALRFTMNNTAKFYIHPATHAASDQDLPRPPMGLRVRLKASFAAPAGASAEAQVLITAFKTYGLILADNGSDWYVSGDSDDGWDPLMDGLLSALGKIKGSDFEVVDSGPTLTPPP